MPESLRMIGQYVRQLRLHVAAVILGVALVAIATVVFSSSALERLAAAAVVAVVYGGLVLLASREISRRGYLVTDRGRLELSKKRDTPWQFAVFDLYLRVGDVLRTGHGYDAFVVYGTLLGQVREGGFIGHDDDFDAAYVSRETDGAAAAEELGEIALSLVEAGLDVEPRLTALHIHDQRDPAIKVDLFHLYFDEAGHLQMPYGHAGDTPLGQDAWDGVEPALMGEHTVLVPKNAQRWVEHIYGATWRVPHKGFRWRRSRTEWAHEAHLPDELRTRLAHANERARRARIGESPER